MRNKKGFTLIELLAIIVILAVIAVITVPIILGIIEDSKKGSVTDSAYGYIDGIDLYNASLLTKGEEALDGIFYVDEIDDDIKITGDMPVEGYVELIRGKVVSYSLKFGEYVVTLDKSTGKVTTVKNGVIRDIRTWAISCDNPDYNPTDEGLFTYTDYGSYIKITGYTGNISDVRIPCSINGKTVTSIGYSVFENNQLTSVVIPNGVTSIGKRAFYQNILTSVVIPDSVTSIGEEAFFSYGGTNKLTSVVIPDSVTIIGRSAFANNQLTSATLGTGLTSIGDMAFYGNNLESIDIAGSVTSIGASAFYSNQLTSITIPDSVTSIGDGAFSNNKLASVVISNGVINIGNNAFKENQLTNVTIPSSVESIGTSAFYKANVKNKKTNTTTFSNINLTTIYNNTGKSFDWKSITGGSSDATFVTGTIPHSLGDITVTTSN